MFRTNQSANGLGGTACVSAAPSRSDSNGIEARGVTDEAAAVLAAAEQSFNSVESLDEAGAAAMASAAAANWSPFGDPSHYHNESGYFPVRALLLPEAPTEEEAPRGETQEKEEAEQGLRGSAADRSEAHCGERDVSVIPSGKDDSTVTTVEDSERDEFRAGGKGSVGGEAERRQGNSRHLTGDMKCFFWRGIALMNVRSCCTLPLLSCTSTQRYDNLLLLYAC